MWKRCSKLALPLLLASLGACSGTTPTQQQTEEQSVKKPAVKLDEAARGRYQKAVWAMQHDRAEEALQLFDQISQRYPDLAGAYINKGLIQLKRGEYKAAKAALLQATTLRPDHAVAFNHLGIACRELGEFDQAEQAYLTALRLKPDYANAHLNIGILYDVYLGQLQKAMHHYQRYMKLTGNHDEQVKKWIADLKLRFGKQSAKVN